MKSIQAKFCIGQVVIDPRFHHRGVIVDVDHQYLGTEAWYNKNAPHRPSKNEPWYHVLVHNSDFKAYVAESTLEPDLSGEDVVHPEVDYFFENVKNGVYILRRSFDV